MGRALCGAAALPVCTATFAIVAALAPQSAKAEDFPPPSANVEQTSSSSASATATNSSSTSQTVTQTQSGGTSGGQSQTTVQAAPTTQSAQASASSGQAATNVAGNGKATQQAHSSGSSNAGNSNTTRQGSSQQQEAAPPPDPSASGGQSQTSAQAAPTHQDAKAKATSTQVAPKNINIVIRVDSPGNDGSVTQTNSSVATAAALNSNSTTQATVQDQTGAASPGGQSQLATQDAPTTQDSTAVGSSTQTAPLNLNIVVRNKSPGDEAPVSQTNSSGASASAANASAVGQSADQAQSAVATGPGGQAQAASQNAPTTQSAESAATSTQTVPTNGAVAVSIDPATADPNGSGALGTLIRIWIPQQPSEPQEVPVQANTSTAGAIAANSNQTTQSADQQQSLEPASAGHLGGGAQTQVVAQNAPTTQTATSSATATEDGSSTSATAIAGNVSNVTQSAEQAQASPPGGGSQLQIVEQNAPTTQRGVADADATGGWEVVTVENSAHATQAAEQRGAGTQIVVQDAPVSQTVGGRRCAGALGRIRCRDPKPNRRRVSRQLRLPTLGPGSWRPLSPLPVRLPEGNGSRRVPTRPARHPDLPLPSTPNGPSAGAGGGSGGGAFAWTFAALLIPLALTAPWWARRFHPSALRRLTEFVLRPERPG